MSTINAAKTVCKNGHDFTPANTYEHTVRGIWRRQCRTCRAIRRRTLADPDPHRHSATPDAAGLRRLLEAERDGVEMVHLMARWDATERLIRAWLKLAQDNEERTA